MTLITNLRGTSETEFRIGVTGPTIYTGTTDPSVTPPIALDTLNTGDFYLRNGGSGRPWFYDGAAWLEVSAANAAGDVTISNNLTVNGQGLFADGNAAAPSISFLNDPATGIHRDTLTTDQMFFSVAGADRMTLQDSLTNDRSSVVLNGTDAMTIHNGTSAERPTTPTTGMMRWNTTLSIGEIWNGTIWADFTASGTGDLLAANNLSDVASIPAAVANLGLDPNGVNDFWVELTGDTMSGNLVMTSGVFEAPPGTVAVPTFTFTGSLNSGVYQEIGNTVSIAVGGVESIQFDQQRFTKYHSGSATTYTSVREDISGAGPISALEFQGSDAVGTIEEYSQITANIVNDTPAGFEGDIEFSVAIAGAGTSIARVVSTGFVPGADATFDLGSPTLTWNTVYGEATSALYADVAERYEADDDYPIGTIMVIGGDKEVTATDEILHHAVVGVVSENPALMMNDGPGKEDWPFLALTGRVPCRVMGRVRKGDRIGTSKVRGAGMSVEGWSIQPGSVVGIAMEDHDGPGVGLIEIVVRPA